jgi:hypothetical protein
VRETINIFRPRRHCLCISYLTSARTLSAPAAGSGDRLLDLTRVDLSTLKWGPITLGSHRIVLLPRQLISLSRRICGRHQISWSTCIAISTPRQDCCPGAFLQSTPLPANSKRRSSRVSGPWPGSSVFFTVSPKPGLPTGTEVRNQASIVFDNNAAIETRRGPTHWTAPHRLAMCFRCPRRGQE